MNNLPAVIEEATAAIRERHAVRPRVGIILGTGMGPLAGKVQAACELPYAELPGFSRATAPGHVGKLVCGELAGAAVCVMQGRPHLYEGHAAEEVALPVRVMRALGAEVLIVTCASGGLNPKYRTGDIVVLEDHVNLAFRNPLIGPDDKRLGPRWPDMCQPYDERLAQRAMELARQCAWRAHRGTYAAMAGPNYETRAEYRMLRRIGADCVGMSTVPEVIVAAQIGLRVLGLSVVTNTFCERGIEENPHHTTADEVLHDATLAAHAVECIIRGVLESSNEG